MQEAHQSTGRRVGAAKVPRNLPHRSRLAVGEQIEGGDLCQREFARRQLLRRRKHELTPEATDGDDATTDLAEALPSS